MVVICTYENYQSSSIFYGFKAGITELLLYLCFSTSVAKITVYIPEVTYYAVLLPVLVLSPYLFDPAIPER